MEKGFYYIVAEVDGKLHFVGRDRSYTDVFDAVLPFDTRQEAEEYAAGLSSGGKKAKILPYCAQGS